MTVKSPTALDRETIHTVAISLLLLVLGAFLGTAMLLQTPIPPEFQAFVTTVLGYYIGVIAKRSTNGKD